MKRADGKKGFTILEVMMAAIVMAFALTTSIITMQRSFLSLDTARNITIAGQIMEFELEQMRMNPWAVISAYPATATPPVDTSFTSNSFVGNRFTLTRDVTDITVSSGTTAGMRQITLTVRWKSYDGHDLSRSYTSFYGENGLYDYFYNSIY